MYWANLSELINFKFNDKSDLSEVKVSLVPEETSDKENFLDATQLD